MPSKEETRRWIEAQFYYIVTDILHIRNNIMDVMNNIDYLSTIGGYNAEFLKQCAQEAISSTRIRPSKEEILLLCRIHNVPVKAIKERFTIHNKTLYNLFESHAKEPRVFYPRFSETQDEHIERYVETFNKFKGAGVYGTSVADF